MRGLTSLGCLGLLFLSLGGFFPSPVRADETPKADEKAVDGAKTPRIVGSRKVDFQVKNNLETIPGRIHVSGSRSLPIRMDVSDTGFGSVRRVRVFVAIYTREDLTRRKAGALVTTYLDPGVMVTQADESSIRPFQADIPLPPGAYVYYVLLCDPDVKYRPDMLPEYFPDHALFPGCVLRTKVSTATITGE